MRSEVWWRPPATRAWLLWGAVALGAAGTAGAKEFSEWSAPVNAQSLSGSSDMINTAANDGCPILDPYSNDLYMASNRPGSTINPTTNAPSLDIWIARWNGSGWDAPVNAGPKINTGADEFCPSPARGNRFFFVRRLSPTNTDIYEARNQPHQGFGTPQPLPRGADAINSDFEEWSPSYFEAGGHEYLYFSSTRVGAPRQQIFYSVDMGPAQLAQGGVNSSASDARPNVRHDGLEIVWDSTRTGSLGGPDIWTATRSSVGDPWGTAEQLGNGINTGGNETRASISWDGTRLMFGTSARPDTEGSTDIWTSTRHKETGGE